MGHADIQVYCGHFSYKTMHYCTYSHHPDRILTDAEGRFRVAGMVPGIRYMARAPLKGKEY